MDFGALKQAFGFFSAFDEISGQSYFFVPAISDKETKEKNQILGKLDIAYRLKKTDK
ncbi:hypothetical protein KKG31_05895 [Patescibacteria group bacterium]|nr:hypothetical protein [Patescibacteria group bacterium]MBU1758636.1 hypothetical protein [Patescibacteria group bacterium]